MSLTVTNLPCGADGMSKAVGDVDARLVIANQGASAPLLPGDDALRMIAMLRRVGVCAALFILTASGPASADSLCMDGTVSESDGSGACSYHGGVVYGAPGVDLDRDEGPAAIYTPSPAYPSPVAGITPSSSRAKSDEADKGFLEKAWDDYKIQIIIGALLLVGLLSKSQQQQPSTALAVPRRSRSGWFPDPTKRNKLRYFDGGAWTSKVSNGRWWSDDPM